MTILTMYSDYSRVTFQGASGRHTASTSPLTNVVLTRTMLTNSELYSTQLVNKALFKDLQERKV